MILGATGGVGSYASQLAALRGASVSAVTRSDYGDYACSLGADDVVDYTATIPADAVRNRHPNGIDVLIDLAGVPDL